VLAKLLKPRPDAAALILRLGIAVIFIVHGFIKVDADADLLKRIFPDSPHSRLVLQQFVGWAELVAGLMMLLGVLSRVASLVIIPMQVAAIILATGNNALEGIKITARGPDFRWVGPEYNLVLIVMCLGVLVLGSGVLSVDHLLWGWWQRRKAQAALGPAPGPVPGEAKVVATTD
jgi:putative oxidoreductase